MGIGNFFDNFISGLAFGMAVNSPFFGGMGCFGGFGYGGRTTEIIDFGTFANPFPNPFAGMNLTQTTQPISLLNNFANAKYPTYDFSQVGKTIWDNVMNPDSEYNKRMREYYDNLKNNNNNQNYTTQTKINGYEMPFSSWYLPNQITFGGYSPFFQTTSITPVKPQTEVKADKTDNTSLEPDNTDAEQITDKPVSYDITALKNKWSKKKDLPNAFYEKVIHISKKIKCDPNDLMGVMWVESDHSFSPTAKNPHGAAVGLIQFMPDTAKALGTTRDKLLAMTAVEQLEYVEKFLVANKTAAGYKDNETINRGTLYSLVFLPGRSKRDVLTTKGEDYYEQNKILDSNKDGKITKADLHKIITDNLA